ncbi:oxidoreductase-like protein [Trypanosoma rangeli]|uniref:Oxidoreductase-like protein n=1 Tax=Trypanosoma rangeli TaxID=5698 RepID=A0A3R7MDU8_TRYRA|nr:oxidoreductase-like protein [Trypanosoma rangeli]RNF00761.1 oxidoreductase-like protein [Trypanosoma rangeli]|eukprot:RNF00761.1 oxidoreductase-like protein [Trypanosoma rangeli]
MLHAVNFQMAKAVVGRVVKRNDKSAIVAFSGELTFEIDGGGEGVRSVTGFLSTAPSAVPQRQTLQCRGLRELLSRQTVRALSWHSLGAPVLSLWRRGWWCLALNLPSRVRSTSSRCRSKTASSRKRRCGATSTPLCPETVMKNLSPSSRRCESGAVWRG